MQIELGITCGLLADIDITEFGVLRIAVQHRIAERLARTSALHVLLGDIPIAARTKIMQMHRRLIPLFVLVRRGGRR